ncbi:MAG: hypothetical protein E7426_03420 [Ruminococcaceae bacterium]|jgi:hypothetical protein|nr:hypothetical protein [Oscillospiraceae bacterium]
MERKELTLKKVKTTLYKTVLTTPAVQPRKSATGDPLAYWYEQDAEDTGALAAEDWDEFEEQFFSCQRAVVDEVFLILHFGGLLAYRTGAGGKKSIDKDASVSYLMNNRDRRPNRYPVTKLYEGMKFEERDEEIEWEDPYARGVCYARLYHANRAVLKRYAYEDSAFEDMVEWFVEEYAGDIGESLCKALRLFAADRRYHALALSWLLLAALLGERVQGLTAYQRQLAPAEQAVQPARTIAQNDHIISAVQGLGSDMQTVLEQQRTMEELITRSMAANEMLRQKFEMLQQSLPSGGADQSMNRTAQELIGALPRDEDEDLPDGFQVVPLENGYYVGDMRNGLPHGEGTVIFPGEGLSHSRWEEGRHCGQGVYIRQDGSVLRGGQWENEDFCGQVQYASPDFTYIGGWRDNEPQGRGMGMWSDGYSYRGEWDGGRFHGHGTFVGDNWMYAGDWVDNQRTGMGHYRVFDEEDYVGQMKEGKFHGYGTCWYTDGTLVAGEWEEDHATGLLLTIARGRDLGTLGMRKNAEAEGVLLCFTKESRAFIRFAGNEIVRQRGSVNRLQKKMRDEFFGMLVRDGRRPLLQRLAGSLTTTPQQDGMTARAVRQLDWVLKKLYEYEEKK